MDLMLVKRPRGILFDNDGVLISSEALHHAAWCELLTELKIPYGKINWDPLIGMTSTHILESLLNEFQPGWSPVDYPLEKLALRKNDYYLQFAEKGLTPYPGVREGLEWLKSQNIPCSVVSNAKRRELHYAMELLEFKDFFQAIISREDTPHPKPHPVMYEQGAYSLGLSPEECLALDDSPTGLQSALLAGCQAASVTSNYPVSALSHPVPGRSDLKTVWVGSSVMQFFDWLKSLPV